MNDNKKIKYLMEKQRQDNKIGMTYGSRAALESDTIPEFIKQVETKKKELLGIRCSFFLCFQKRHRTTRANKCQYHGVRNEEELNEKINA